MRRLLLFSIVVLTAACAERPTAAPTRLPAATTATTPAPTPLPTTQAATMAAPSPGVPATFSTTFPATEVGARGIAQAFFTSTAHADATGDGSWLRKIAAPTCQCLKALPGLAKSFAEGERHLTPGWQVHSIRVLVLKAHAASLEATYDLPPATFLLADGKRERRAGFRGEHAAINLDGSSGHWLIVSAVRLKAGTPVDA